jgi:Protein of unknown function (DUF732)
MSLRNNRFAAHLQRWIIAPLVPLVAAAAFATPAHADDQSYLDYIRSHGVPVLYAPHYVGLGYQVCAQLHAGMSPADAANQFGIGGQIWGPQLVYGAQHELCPDTLPAS